MAFILADDKTGGAKQAKGGFVLERSPEPTQRQKDITSVGSRFIRGMNQPIEGAAQALQHALPDSAVNAVNEFADWIGGPGTFLGDKLGIKGMTREQLDTNIKQDAAEFQEAREAVTPDTMESMMTGKKDVPYDVAGLVGEAASPVNLALGMGAGGALAKEGVKQAAVKLGLLGGLAAGAQPLTSTDSFAGDKLMQAGVGAATGAVLGPVLMKATDSLGKFVRDRVSQGAAGRRSSEEIGAELSATLKRDGIELSQIPERIRFELIEDVKKALKEGKDLDVASIFRRKEFEKLGITPTLGQITRDPGQYSKELNLRGIQGAGEPLQDRLALQQEQISGKFREKLSGAKESYEAGADLIKDIEGKNFEMEQGVRKAYKAFRDSTGKELEVPLTGLSQDYARILRDYDTSIPSAVRNQFEALGLMSGKQQKVLNIEDAENLIKTMNKNFNPADRPSASALGELRTALTKAIDSGADAGGDTLGAQLARTARGTAAERFKTIEQNPAFKAAINDKAAPDDFIRKYVIGGKADDIERLTNLVSPASKKQIAIQTMRFLQNKAFGANAAGDASSRQAGFNQELSNIGTRKLEALLGKEQAAEMQSLGRVMAYIQSRPAGSSVNESGTAAAVMNILSKVGGGVKGAPYINDFVVKPIEGMQQRRAVSNALAGKLPEKAAKLDPKAMKALSRLVGASTVLTGAALGANIN